MILLHPWSKSTDMSSVLCLVRRRGIPDGFLSLANGFAQLCVCSIPASIPLSLFGSSFSLLLCSSMTSVVSYTHPSVNVLVLVIFVWGSHCFSSNPFVLRAQSPLIVLISQITALWFRHEDDEHTLPNFSLFPADCLLAPFASLYESASS